MTTSSVRQGDDLLNFTTTPGGAEVDDGQQGFGPADGVIEFPANKREDLAQDRSAHHDFDMSDTTERVARLEAQFAHVDKTLDEIKLELREGRKDTMAIRERLASMPTTNGLWGMIATVIAVGIAIAGLTFVIADYAAR